MTSQSQAIKEHKATEIFSLGDGLARNWALKEHLEQWDFGVSAMGFASRTSQSDKSKDHQITPLPMSEARRLVSHDTAPWGEEWGNERLGRGCGDTS